jgi:triosephosphate isomerase
MLRIHEFKVQSSKFKVDQEIGVAIAPSFPLISTMNPTVNYELRTTLALCAQDCSPLPPGQHTGETSAVLLAELGVKYCLVGHAERRKYFSETNEIVARKARCCTDNKIIPIVCAQSLTEIPETIHALAPEQYYLMYEPLAAISTGGQYHPEPAEKIAETLSSWQARLPAGVRFLYGGSISSENVSALTSKLITNNSFLFSGLVVGHASLDPAAFSAIIHQLENTLPATG